jgi:NADPH2:quinone reductase
MKSINFEQTGLAKDVLFLTNSEIPKILPGEVLVKVMARPINPSDYMFIQDQYRIRPNLPQIAGLEGSGIIVNLDEAISDFKAGDHVAFRSTGTWAEYVTVKEKELISIKPDIPFEISCQIALNPVTAYALFVLTECKTDAFLLISAASSALSRIIIQIAKEEGVKVICLVRDVERRNELLQLGAFEVLSENDQDIKLKIMAITDNVGVDAFLDAVGGTVLSNCVKVMKQFGKIILYGRYATGFAELFNEDAIYKNLTITGFGIGQWLAGKSKKDRELIFEEITNKVAAKKLSLPQTHSYKMEAVAEALLFDEAKKNGKVILIS